MKNGKVEIGRTEDGSVRMYVEDIFGQAQAEMLLGQAQLVAQAIELQTNLLIGDKLFDTELQAVLWGIAQQLSVESYAVYYNKEKNMYYLFPPSDECCPNGFLHFLSHYV